MLNWLKTFLEEKNISLDSEIVVNNNYMTVETIVEFIKIAPKHEQNGIKNMLVKIDFHNGNVLHYFNHLAQAVAI